MAAFSREHVFKPQKEDNSSLLGETLQEVDIDNRVHRKDQGAFLDTQIQPITGSCMEARPKGQGGKYGGI